MRILPTKGRLLVRRDKIEEKTAGGIIIPEIAKERAQACSIVAVAGDVQDYHVGQRVYIGRWGGSNVAPKQEDEILSVRPDEILAILEEE